MLGQWMKMCVSRNQNKRILDSHVRSVRCMMALRNVLHIHQTTAVVALDGCKQMVWNQCVLRMIRFEYRGSFMNWFGLFSVAAAGLVTSAWLWVCYDDDGYRKRAMTSICQIVSVAVCRFIVWQRIGVRFDEIDAGVVFNSLSLQPQCLSV